MSSQPIVSRSQRRIGPVSWTSIVHPSNRFCAVVLAGIIGFQAVIHLAWLPVSGQSGLLLVPWLIRQGGVVFDTIIEERPPILPWLVAAIQSVSPQDPILTLRMLNLLLVICLTLIIFCAARKRANPLAGLLAALFWCAFEPVFGNILLYFNSVLGALFLVAVVAWDRLNTRPDSWVAPLIVGLILGLCGVLKQQAWVVVAAVGIWIVVVSGRHRLKSGLGFGLGAALPFLVLLLMLQFQGTLEEYIYWNWLNNIGSGRPLSLWTGDYLRKVLLSAAFVPVFSALAWRGSDRRSASLVLIIWLAAFATQVPTNGEIYVMAQLPLVSLMTGITGAALVKAGTTEPRTISRQANYGFLSLVFVLWAWMVGSAFVPGPLGPARIPGYDEFALVAERVEMLEQPGDTLFVLPELDGSAQLHVMTELPPPGRWIPGHFWFLNASNVVPDLLEAWASDPPTFIVHFPDMAEASQPYIAPLIQFMHGAYTRVATIPDVPFNGDAEIWQLNAG